jgi:uncharacterized protein (TIGR00369 family)
MGWRRRSAATIRAGAVRRGGTVGYRGDPMAIPSAEQLNAVLVGFDRLYGLELTELSETEVRARVALREELKQAAGLMHGGVIASVAEAIASLATGLAVLGQGQTSMGLANNTSFLRPLLQGTLHAVANVLHRGRTTWVWEVRFSDDDGRLCAVTRMTIAVRALPAG